MSWQRIADGRRAPSRARGVFVFLLVVLAWAAITARAAAAPVSFSVTPVGVAILTGPGGADGVPGRPAVADFNGDGNADIAVPLTTSPPGPQSTVLVLFGDGSGVYRTNNSATTTVDGVVGALAAADVDRDGKVDLVATSAGLDLTFQVLVLVGDGAGHFSAGASLPVGTPPIGGEPPHGPGPTSAADLNGDGYVDLLTPVSVAGTRTIPGTLSMWVGDGHGGFASLPTQDLPGVPAALIVSDLTGDHEPDIALADYAPPPAAPCPPTCGPETPGTAWVLRGNGTGAFAPVGQAPVGSTPSGLVAADFNRDGKLDLAVSSDPSVAGLSVLMGNGSGGLAATATPDVGGAASAVASADFNGDGAPDLATTSGYRNGVVSVLLGDGHGTFSPPSITYVQADVPVRLATADLNRDGRPDLVTANTGSDSLSILLNQGEHPGGGSVQPPITAGGSGGPALSAGTIMTPPHHDAGVVRVSRRGGFQLPRTTIICANSEGRCSVHVVVTTGAARQGRRTTRRRVVLTARTFAIRPGAKSGIRLALSPRGMRLLRRARTLKGRATIAIRKPGAAVARTAVSLTLRAPVRR